MIPEKMVRDYIDNLQVILDAPCDHGGDLVAMIECSLRKAHISTTIQLMKDILEPPEQMLTAMKNSAHAALEIKRAEQDAYDAVKNKGKIMEDILKQMKRKDHGDIDPIIWGTKPSSN